MHASRTRNWLVSTALLGTLFLASCSSSSQLNQPLSSKDPQFLDNIALNGTHNSELKLSTATQEKKVNIQPSFGTTMQQKYASLLGVLPTTISNYTLYHFIDDWMGVRYKLGGNSKTGIDCSAFVQRMFETVFCMDLLRTAREQFANAHLIRSMDSLSEGDLVFFKIKTTRISHVGVYLANRRFVHASSSQGVTISSLDERYWQRYYTGGGRVL